MILVRLRMSKLSSQVLKLGIFTLRYIALPTVMLTLLGACSTTENTKPRVSSISEFSISSKFKILDKHPVYGCINSEMGVFIEVFGMYVIATDGAPDEYVIHTANVLAQYIDNDEDGNPDDPSVLNYLVKNNVVVPVWREKDRAFEDTKCGRNFRFGASMWYDEDKWAIGGIQKTGDWDANLEEVWHIVTIGWEATYPESFGAQMEYPKSSLLTSALDVARGGHFADAPSQYPSEAWYTYYDPSCGYECQAYEYVYWALMANIGALDPQLTDKCERVADEWNICTASELRNKDILISQLLNDKGFRLPTRIPDGSYQ